MQKKQVLKSLLAVSAVAAMLGSFGVQAQNNAQSAQQMSQHGSQGNPNLTGKAANDDRADWREARCFQAMCLCLACRRPCLHGGRQSGCIRIRELKSAYELESGGTPCTSIRRGMTHQSPSRSPMRVAKIL